MSVLTFVNDGQLIVETNYWQSEYARAGKVMCSVNADRRLSGAIKGSHCRRDNWIPASVGRQS